MQVFDSQPNLFSPLSTSVALSGLRPGYSAETIIQELGGHLYVPVGNARVPLEPESPLLPNQPVRVEIVQTENGPQVRVTPLDVTPQPAVPASASSNSAAALASASTTLPSADAAIQQRDAWVAALTPLLRSLGEMAALEELPGLVPSQTPLTPELSQSVAVLLAGMGGAEASEDGEQIAAFLRAAIAARVIPASDAEPLLALLGRPESTWMGQADRLQTLVTEFARQAAQSTEGRLAALLTQGDEANPGTALAADLRTGLARLAADPALRDFLTQSGHLKDFTAAVDRVVDRTLGMQMLTAARAGQQPYLFTEIPFPSETGMRRVQVHWMSEGRKRNSGRNERSGGEHLVALDLNMTRLGDLWISLWTARGLCVCRFRAAAPEAVQAIQDNAGELASALKAAGHPGARVEAVLWDGNRMRETAAFLRQLSGMSFLA